MITALNNISAYGLCGAAGFLLGIGYLLFAAKMKSEDFNDLVYVYVWAAMGAVIGAKLLYILIEIPDVARKVQEGADLRLYLRNMVSGGFVFYGGLLGAVLAVKAASKYFALDFCKVITILTPAMPLAHALGRVGCAVVGCCYGRETRMCIGISYADSMYAPNGVRLFPVQILEALADLLIFGVLVFLLLKAADSYAASGIFGMYLVMYASIRFLLEFMRGDSVRGHLGWFSTSQWISIVILLLAGTQKISKRRWIERE